MNTTQKSEAKYFFEDVQINTIRNILNYLTCEEFIKILNLNKNKDEFINRILYYLWIFRDDKEVQEFINSGIFPADVLFQFIYFGYGRWILADCEPEEYFIQNLDIFNPAKCLNILLNTEVINSDPTLAMFFIANLSIELLEKFLYCSERKNDAADFFLEIFNTLEEANIKKYFIKNPGIYNYILRLFQKKKLTSKKYQIIYDKYKEDFKVIDKVSCICKKIAKYDALCLSASNELDGNRIAAIVREVRGISNVKEIISLLQYKKIFHDETEKCIVYSVLTDDFFKQFLRNP
ncbi:MAG: hypothetical protein H7A25_22600 [Leptospiraceae bacterium]|nr:hypothetical protein [Leptospiraceae bacterium]MCP5502706.1 hypothetical protein [Leptospiraceae bacterium]